MYRVIPAVLLVAASTGGSGASAMDEFAQTAITRSIDRFRQAFNAGDVDAMSAHYADDLVKLRQGAPPEGKPEVVRRLRQTFREYSGHLDVTTDEVVVSGAIAYTRGSYVVTLTPKAHGEITVVRRRSLEIWRRDGEVWRACRAMDNTDGL